ncbi:MAG: DUF2807 domain-containing protein [Bacteroidales bacterium]|nr:DUF2807 domain-containing protein [Bacteroidales bacterium]
MRSISILSLAIFSTILWTSCTECVSPEGPSREESRTITEVREIELAGEIDVLIMPSDTPFLVVRGADNIRQLLRTDLRGHTLRISTEKCVLDDDESQVIVGMKDLQQVIVGGSGLIATNGLFSPEEIHIGISGSGEARLQINAENVATSISGSGRIVLEGITDHLKANVAGSGALDASDLQADNCEVLVAGSGSAEIAAGRKLRARVNGSGNVRYSGDPEVDIRVTGSGEITRIH